MAIYDILLDYHCVPPELYNSRDLYATSDEIEVRRSVQLLNIIDQWKEGKHPLLVMAEALETVFPWYSHPISSLLSSLTEAKKAQDRLPARAALESDINFSERRMQEAEREWLHMLSCLNPEVIRFCDPECQTSSLSPDLVRIIDRIKNSDQDSAGIILSIAEAIFSEERQEQNDPLKQIRQKIAKVREQDIFSQNNRPKTKGLQPITEFEVRKRIESALVRNDARNEAKRRICDNITIEAVDAASIRPDTPFSYKRDGDDDMNEHIYGVDTAQITTYRLSFGCAGKEDLDTLHFEVERALQKLSHIDPVFSVPKEGGYRRPQKHEEFHSNIYLVKEEGKIIARIPLDLDDVMNLVYLMEDVLQPSQQIAAALYQAMYDEERSAPIPVQGFLSEGASLSDQLGDLSSTNHGNLLGKVLRDMEALLAKREIDLSQLQLLIGSIAHHSLEEGRLGAPKGMLPSFRRLADQRASEGGSLTYQDALKGRAREIAALLAGCSPEEKALMPSLIHRMSETGEAIRHVLREDHLQRERMYRQTIEHLCAKVAGRPFQSGKDDLISGLRISDRFADCAEPDDHKKVVPEESITRSHVGACLDRIWPPLGYRSKLRGPLIRYEMPSFLPSPGNDYRQQAGVAIQALTWVQP